MRSNFICVQNNTILYRFENKLKLDLYYLIIEMVVPFVYTEEEYKELEERIRFLEQCLDNKEKVNKSLREENKRLSDFLECES